MKRVSMAVTGILMVVFLALLIARWQAVGFSLATTATSLLVILGLPVILWLWLEHRPVAARRSMPRFVWVGLGLVVVGAGGLTAGLAAAPPSTHQTVSVPSGAPAIHTVAVPRSAAHDLGIAFPGFVPIKAWGNGQGTYEIWLRQRSHPGYALQIMWIPGKVMGVQNQEYNTLYRPGPGKPLPLNRIKERVAVANSRGPFVFPGYVLYVVPSRGTEVVVSRTTGIIQIEESW